MMMSKPAPEEEEKEAAAPAFATAPPAVQAAKTGSVEDLERRLAMLGGEEEDKKPAAVEAPPVETKTAPAAPAAAMKGGKNALLARIMAAKEKSQQAKVAPAPTEQPKTGGDLLMDFDAPSAEKDPPPSYGTNFLGDAPPAPVAAAPPAFDTVESNVMNQVQQQTPPAFPPPPPIDSVMPPPPPIENVMPPPPLPEDNFMMMAPSAPAASAPSFEDLLGGGVKQQTNEMHPPPMAPPVQQAPELDIDESILNALEPAEREAFLEEQRKIMEQIEKNKAGSQPTGGAASRAAAFDQRSTAAVAQVAASYDGSSSSRTKSKKSSSSRSKPSASASSGTVNLGDGVQAPVLGSEKTQQAINDGTALIVQCMSCSNWMQVTEEAEVMFCPICQTVCHVEKKGAAKASDMEGAAQMAADAELAEKMQKEEYARAQGGGGGGSSSRRRQNRAAAPAAAASGDQSWYDWLTGAPAPAPPAASGSRSGEIRPQRGLVAATTGEEFGASRSRSYDESEGLMGGGGARVAQQKSMFACVTDSIADAATQMTGVALSEDQEGNVHGVDGSSLLAMPDVSRERQGGSS
ncbi:MAG: hypothetical protein SGILL_007206 [Bacillariaceae sp.]